MNKTWKVVQWEVMRNLLNKQYLIGLLITPVIFVLFAGAPTLLEKFDRPASYTYLVRDEIGLFAEIEAGLSESNINLIRETGTVEELEVIVQEQKQSGYLLFDAEFWDTGEVQLFFRQRNNQSERAIATLLSTSLQQRRLQELGFDQSDLTYVSAQATLERTPLEEAIAPKRNEIIVSIAFIILIFFLIFSSGSMLMQSALQERRDRMAEIVLSSISPSQLMQGKIIGHFLLGMIQLSFWILLSLPAVILLLEFPVWQALGETNLILIFLFGLLGYLLFSSIFVSMGATMEDLQSAGNSQGLVIMIPMLSFLFLAPVTNNPDGLISRFASLFPITSPMIMILRSSLTRVPWWEVVLSVTILLLSSYFVIKIAAKIFRIGMLMYGKTANFSEIIKWVKYKES